MVKVFNISLIGALGVAHAQSYGSAAAAAPTCPMMALKDSYGDGWNGATGSFTGANGATTVTLSSGGHDQKAICLPNGCYKFEVHGGSWKHEISFTFGGVTGKHMDSGGQSMYFDIKNGAATTSGPCNTPSATPTVAPTVAATSYTATSGSYAGPPTAANGGLSAGTADDGSYTATSAPTVAATSYTVTSAPTVADTSYTATSSSYAGPPTAANGGLSAGTADASGSYTATYDSSAATASPTVADPGSYTAASGSYTATYDSSAATAAPTVADSGSFTAASGSYTAANAGGAATYGSVSPPANPCDAICQAAGPGMCTSPADGNKPECAACAACHDGTDSTNGNNANGLAGASFGGSGGGGGGSYPAVAAELVEVVPERSGAISNLSGLVAASSLLALLALVAVQRSTKTRRREYQALDTIV